LLLLLLLLKLRTRFLPLERFRFLKFFFITTYSAMLYPSQT
jgi:hypothetical protein